MKDSREPIAHGNEEEEEEPPMLGDEDDAPLLETDGDNQREEAAAAPSSASDASLMEEILAVAARAKDEKRRVSERERNRKAFGDGLKKGFFNRPAKATDRQRKAGANQPKAGIPSREERLRIVKPPTPEADAETAANTPSFVFPEVQEAMKGAEQLDPKEWMNAQFFEKLAQNPRLSQALRNPAFSQAIADMQADPRAAMLKYQKDAAVSAMLRDFMAFLGAHFEEIGKQAANSQQQHVAPPQAAASKPAAIQDLDATRRAALSDMPRSPQEEAQVQKILAEPELLRALLDGALMQQLRECQQAPGKLREQLADARTGPKLRLLIDNGLVTFDA